MRRPRLRRPLAPVLVVGLASVLLTGCGGGDAGATDGAAAVGADSAAATASTASPSENAATPGGDAAPYAFTEADLDAWERGLAREIELVRAARERQGAAGTPQARAEAAQAQWEDQTIPLAAQSLGSAGANYAATRRTVHEILTTLDFQGKIDGPMQLDTTRVAPEQRARLTVDPYAGLAPASAAALQARLARVVPRWIEYVNLTAVGG